jgi:hypothetical protein
MERTVSVEVIIYCDECSMVMAAGKTAAQARASVADKRSVRLALRGGQDICWDCGEKQRIVATYGSAVPEGARR